MARIITFASSKGGTGKTVLVANIGAAMAKLGRKVAIIDADISMANLGLMTGLEGQKTTLHQVLAGEAPASKAACNGPCGLKILPMGISIDGINRANPDRLDRALKELAHGFDIMLVDSPSGMDRDAIAALKVAKELVIVVTPDIASLSNSLKLKAVAERLGIKPIGVIVSMASGKELDLSKQEISQTLELPVLGEVPEDGEVRRALAMGECVVTQSPGSPAAVEMKKIAAAISGQMT